MDDASTCTGLSLQLKPSRNTLDSISKTQVRQSSRLHWVQGCRWKVRADLFDKEMWFRALCEPIKHHIQCIYGWTKYTGAITVWRVKENPKVEKI